MICYRCVHCLAILAQFIEGEEQPACADHPNGIVELRDLPTPDA